MTPIPIIFSHYGNTSYLAYSLACARRTNPQTRLIFLGDESNFKVAKDNGWEHFNFSDFRSNFHPKFESVFRHVQGKKHTHIKNGRDWLRYVFERWFFIEAFVSLNGINRFWHFDSDTMILKDLELFNQDLIDFEFTVQCGGTCLNGIVSSLVVSEFCNHINNLFDDKHFINSQQLEFNTINPGWAFTEMRAFDDYKKGTSRKWIRILNYGNNMAFDDCICQEHGFDMCTLGGGEYVKNIYSKNGELYGKQYDQEIKFVTLNLSWVKDYVFEWTLYSLNNNGYLKNVKCTPMLQLIGYLKRIKRFLKNI
jgi:hypothetical protein